MSILARPHVPWRRQQRRAAYRRALGKQPQHSESIGIRRRARRAAGIGTAALACLLFASQLEAFHDAADAARPLAIVAQGTTATLLVPDKSSRIAGDQLTAMSAFSLRFLHKGAAAAGIIYDTSIGNGVDTNGFASLPLRSGGTDGADLATAAPTLGSGVTYDSGTRTFSVGFLLGNPARWNGILTIGQTYRLYLYYRVDSGSDLVIKDESGNIQVTIDANAGGATVIEGVFDSTFVATGTDLVFSWTGGGFGGKVRMGKVCTNSGGVPAHRFFVRPSTGADTNDGLDAQSSSTPLATIAQALKYLSAGRGDQILLAEGASFTTLPILIGRASGYSAVYPAVIQSYDPADPTNEAKYGRAATANQPTFTNPLGSAQSGPGALNYLALRGLKFSAGNIADQSFDFTGNTNPFNYLLVENCRFAYCALTFDMSPSTSKGQKVIVRNCALYGTWGSTAGNRLSNFFADNTNLTLEDNVNYHAGWKIGANRDDDPSIGGLGSGAGIFRHPWYVTCDMRLVNDMPLLISRRNFTIDGAADGGTHRTSVQFTENLLWDNPINISLGGGDSYNLKMPDGVDITATRNAVIGAPDITTADPRGWGIVTANGRPGSSATYNLLVRGGKGGTTDAQTLLNVADYTTQASVSGYMTFDHNVGYDFSLSGSALKTAGLQPSISAAQTAFSNNASDDPPSGSNTTSSLGSFPNAYASSTALAIAAGYASRQALIDAALDDPSAHIQRTVRALLMTGYGMTP